MARAIMRFYTLLPCGAAAFMVFMSFMVKKEVLGASFLVRGVAPLR